MKQTFVSIFLLAAAAGVARADAARRSAVEADLRSAQEVLEASQAMRTKIENVLQSSEQQLAAAQLDSLQQQHQQVQKQREHLQHLIRSLNVLQLQQLKDKLMELTEREQKLEGSEHSDNISIEQQLDELLHPETILAESEAQIETWLVKVMDEQVQQVVQEYVHNATSSSSSSCGAVTLEMAANKVQHAVVEYSLDGIGLYDHLQHPQTSIVHEMTSDTYRDAVTSSWQQQMFQEGWRRYIPEDWEWFLSEWADDDSSSSTMPWWLWHHATTTTTVAPPEAILESSTLPGACWSLAGRSGHVTIRLPYPVQISSITIDHASKLLMEHQHSAPKRIKVYGYPPCDDNCAGLGFDVNRRTSLMRVEYDINAGSSSVQTFGVEERGNAKDRSGSSSDDSSDDSCSADAGACRSPYEDNQDDGVFAAVQLEIRDNWGNDDYTCLYRVRVHGEAQVE